MRLKLCKHHGSSLRQSKMMVLPDNIPNLPSQCSHASELVDRSSIYSRISTSRHFSVDLLFASCFEGGRTKGVSRQNANHSIKQPAVGCWSLAKNSFGFFLLGSLFSQLPVDRDMGIQGDSLFISS